MTVRLISLGCKVNQVESQAIAALFSERGFTPVKSGRADVIVINSCTVTAEADRKTRQTVRRARRENPDAVVVLTGCMPQVSPEASPMPEADIIIGTRNKSEIPSLVEGFISDRRKRTAVTPHKAACGFEILAAERFDDSFQKAYLKIEDGCDRFCAYCIIPFARGEVRSLPIREVKEQAIRLIKNGYREIILTGINLSRYGREEGLTLADAVECVDSLEGDFRIRLGSLEPDLISLSDWERMARCKKLCPHFHPALQSGCDETLLRMKRRYTTSKYKEALITVRTLFPAASVTTDIMVGFPGETDEEFEKTLTFVRELSLMSAHIFVYSKRPGTPAAKMPQVPPDIAVKRRNALFAAVEESGMKYAEKSVGKTVRVLAEANGLGTADDGLEVILPEGAEIGKFCLLTLTEAVGPAKCRAVMAEKDN